MHKILLKMGYKNYRGDWQMDEIKGDAMVFACLGICITLGIYFG